jgi:hypothetical protein
VLVLLLLGHMKLGKGNDRMLYCYKHGKNIRRYGKNRCYLNYLSPSNNKIIISYIFLLSKYRNLNLNQHIQRQ